MKKRGVTIAGNWKMNQVQQETQAFFLKLTQLVSVHLLDQQDPKNKDLDCLIFAPPLSLEKAIAGARELKKAPFEIQIGAQNAWGEKKGAFTGEISGPMLKELGVNWVLLGHSERRHCFGETSALIQSRVQGLLSQDFNLCVCVGETLSERQANETKKVLEAQLQDSLPKDFDGSSQLVIAYEPIWAIGTGLTASPEQAEESHAWIRAFLEKKWNLEIAEKTRILYGGSVTPQNIKELLSRPNIDGALVGGASLQAENYLALIQAGLEVF